MVVEGAIARRPLDGADSTGYPLDREVDSRHKQDRQRLTDILLHRQTKIGDLSHSVKERNYRRIL